MNPAGRIDAIEALRAVAVTWVVLFHYLVARDPGSGDPGIATLVASPLAHAIVRNGYLGVDIFFLITGFLLILPWAGHRAGLQAAPDTRAFYVRRIRRIVPAYYVQLALLVFLFVPLVLGADYLARKVAFVSYNFVAHALFLHYTTPLSSASYSINGALWSLALEAQFYLLLPLLAPAFVKRPASFAIAMLALAALWRWLAMNGLETLVNLEMALGARAGVPEAAVRHLLMTQLPGYLAHFAAGMLAGMAWLRHAHGQPSQRSEIGWTIGLATALSILYWVYCLAVPPMTNPHGVWLVTLIALVVVLLSAASCKWFERLVLARKPLLFVGLTSYSTYLYHLPLLMVWNRFGVLNGSGWSLPAYLATVLGVAWLSWFFVERPFMRARPRKVTS